MTSCRSDFQPSGPLTDELFIAIQTLNEAVRLERSPEGALVIVTLPGTWSADAEMGVGSQVRVWSEGFGGRGLGAFGGVSPECE